MVGDENRRMGVSEMITLREIFIADVKTDTTFLVRRGELNQTEKQKLGEIVDGVEQKEKAAQDITAEADKEVESVERQRRGSPSLQVKCKSTAPVAGGISTSNRDN